MIILSNKPNVRGIKKVAEDVKYRTQLIGRDGRLFAGLISTRVTGMGMGFIFALILVGLPALLKILGVF
ncbi:tetrahydromethanopterin S-methyltransferase subunit F [Enterococcus faecium]|jgi:tetrahydromethanopterin S-methyltransferase subunit F